MGDALFPAVLESAVVDATTDEYRAGVISTMTILQKLAKSTAPACFGLVIAFGGDDSRLLLAAAIAVAYVFLLALVPPGRTA